MCRILIAVVKKPLATSRDSLHAVFVVFKAAFGSALKDKVILTLTEVGSSMHFPHVHATVQQEDRIIIANRMAELPLFSQTIGLARDENLILHCTTSC